MTFDFSGFTEEDFGTAISFIGSQYREPDLVITGADNKPYLYRWWVTPRFLDAQMYFHIQVGSDPARPLHDHPWDNMSVILAGGYIERLQHQPPWGHVLDYPRKKGDVIFRKAEWCHRLILPEGCRYTMTSFMTGPKVHDWGFWVKGVHHGFKEFTEQTPDGRSIWHGPDLTEEQNHGPTTI